MTLLFAAARTKLVKIPQHVAIIPDGNRRWARQRGLPGWAGHLKGYEVARRVLNALWELGVRAVTFYALSYENCLRRPAEELEKLHKLLGIAVSDLLEDKRVIDGKVRVLFVGDFELLPKDLAKKLEHINNATRSNGPFTLAVGVCYSGRREIVSALLKLLEEVCKSEKNIRKLNEEILRSYMPLGTLPEPDLIIRTGGERRLSNFILYHAAYSELYFTETLWPDFTVEELLRALEWFSSRERRFGA